MPTHYCMVCAADNGLGTVSPEFTFVRINI